MALRMSQQISAEPLLYEKLADLIVEMNLMSRILV